MAGLGHVAELAGHIARLGWQAAWTLVTRSALFVTVGIMAGCLGALVVWMFVVPLDASMARLSAVGSPLVLYPIAGCVWGIYLAYRTANLAIIPTVIRTAPELTKAIVDPLCERTSLGNELIAISDAREAMPGMLGEVERQFEPGQSRFRVLRIVQKFLVVRGARLLFARAENILDQLARSGETSISAGSLALYFQTKLIDSVVAAVRAHLWAVGLKVLLVDAALFLIPLTIAFAMRG
ncbi:MAG: hypothetical protein AB7O26_01090 [Planctomycetaceae bacterium]